MDIGLILKASAAQWLNDTFAQNINATDITINLTPAEFDGDFSIVVFPFVRFAKMKPEELADALGKQLTAQVPQIASYNVVKGFCNFVVQDDYWVEFALSLPGNAEYGRSPRKNSNIVLEFSSPNTNKPLHLGHVRNNLIGYSMYKILDYAGYDVIKTQVINDRGIHICKSMLAWKLFGNGATPASTGEKSDHLVGSYYVKFENAFQEEYKTWQNTDQAQSLLQEWLTGKGGEKARKDLAKKGDFTEDQLPAFYFKEVYKNTYFNTYSPLGLAANKMLQDWEAGDQAVRDLWSMMNGWVYEGMNETYKNLGVSFDLNYYESETYLLGKDIVEKGIESGVFFRKEDSSVWIDLKDVKLDEKLVVRSNGTSVYITQDIGMAPLRYDKFKMDKMVYVVGDEQEYHFKVLFEILKRLGEPYAAGLYHLSYGMVDLTTGKMKSREGTVVDADDLITEVVDAVREESSQRDTLSGLPEAEQEAIYRKIGLGALKFFILKVNAKNRMTFDPSKSIDLQGQTGPYIQNAYVRTQAVQRKAADMVMGDPKLYSTLLDPEKQILRLLHDYAAVVTRAADTYSPSDIANYAYEIARAYHHFWAEVSILKDTPEAVAFRIELSKGVANVLASAMGLLGIEMPDRM